MIRYQTVIDRLKKAKQNKIAGGHNAVPWPFPRLDELLMGIERGQAIGILSGTGGAKSKISRFIFLYHFFKFCKTTGYKGHVLLFPLEDNWERVYYSLICYYLAEEKGINISVKELRSRSKSPLPDFVEDVLEEAYEYFEELESFVDFAEECYTPTEIYNYCREYAKKTGKWNKETEDYESDIHTIVLIDNFSNLTEEDDYPTERLAMVGLARDYMRKILCNKLHFTVVAVLQQSFDKERQQFTHAGTSLLAKLEPSLDGIGDAKVIARSFHLILGLFSPDRYELIQYPIPHRSDPENCYRIDLLGDRFRSIKIVKSNDSEVGRKTSLLFNPHSEVFQELPLPKTPEIEKVYQSFKDKLTTRIDPKQEVPAINSTFVFGEESSDEPF